jgi:hypothetical protein
VVPAAAVAPGGIPAQVEQAAKPARMVAPAVVAEVEAAQELMHTAVAAA